MNDVKVRQSGNSVILTVKVVPGSSRTAFSGVLDGMLKIKVALAAEKGKANRELISFVAKRLGKRKNDVQIISGQTNPVKQLQISGVVCADIARGFGLD